MQIPPAIEEIKKWLIKENPLNLFEDDFFVKDIDPKAWSGHFNYLVETPQKRLVLRFKGPEWGEQMALLMNTKH